MAAPADFIPPELATLVDKAPVGDAWVHEIKFDGYRIAARLNGGKATLLTRRGLDWTERFRAIADELRLLKRRDAYLDGEIVALTAAGVSDFGGLQQALSSTGAQRDGLVYFVFDLLWLGGKDLRGEPLRDRKAMLLDLLGKAAMTHVRFSDHVAGDGTRFFRQACKAGLEGIVSKRAGASYRSGRVGDWLKVKCTKRQEFVVGGWQQSDKKGRALASLLLGYYDKAGKLIYAGKVGTGFAIEQGYELVAQLTKRSRPGSPFVDVPRAETRGAQWTAPRMVVEVEFTEWTRDGVIRHPSFKGIREDKPARQVRREKSVRVTSGQA
jgi:bifunctional non-homologous end joining protein LigD